MKRFFSSLMATLLVTAVPAVAQNSTTDTRQPNQQTQQPADSQHQQNAMGGT